MSFMGGAQDNEQDQDDNGKEGGGAGGMILLFVIFFPVVVVAAIIYFLMRVVRLRPSVILAIVGIVEVLCVASWFGFGVFERILDIAMDWSNIAETWSGLILPIVLISVFVGAPLGMAVVWWEFRQMKKNPHRVVLEGNWMHKFNFRATPAELVRRKIYIKKLKAGALQENDRSPVGLALPSISVDAVKAVPAYRYVTEAIKHTLITGGTGSGKSITMLSLMLADIQAGRPLILIDLKGDPKIAAKLAAWADSVGSHFSHFMNGAAPDYDIPLSPGQSFYDPLKSGSATSKADMVLGMREYEAGAAVYKAGMQQLLQVTFAMLEQADRSKAPSIDWDHGGVYQIASAVANNNIVELAAACEGKEIQASADAIAQASMGKTQIKHAIDELQGQMRTIVASEYGRWLKTNANGENNIDLFHMTQKFEGKPGNVILFSLNSDSEPEFAKFVGSMIMSDITATSARRRNRDIGNPVSVYIDEFQVLTPDSVKSLLEKSRASGIAMTLAQQSFDQVIAASPSQGEAYLMSILDTCSNFIVHAGATQDSAERLSKILGKDWFDAYRTSNKNESSFLSFNWSNRRNQTVQTFREERWIVEPLTFMKLSSPEKSNGFKSTAVIVNKTCSDPIFKKTVGAVARTVHMVPSGEVLKERYFGALTAEREENDTKSVELNSVVAALGAPSNVVLDTEGITTTNAAAVRSEAPSRPSKVQLEEDEDGGFEFEELYETEDEEPDTSDMLSFSAFDAEIPVAVEPKRIPPTSASSTSSFKQLKENSQNAKRDFGSAVKEGSLRNQTKTDSPPQPPKQKKVAPQQSATPAPKVSDSGALPDLDFSQL